MEQGCDHCTRKTDDYGERRGLWLRFWKKNRGNSQGQGRSPDVTRVKLLEMLESLSIGWHVLVRCYSGKRSVRRSAHRGW